LTEQAVGISAGDTSFIKGDIAQLAQELEAVGQRVGQGIIKTVKIAQAGINGVIKGTKNVVCHPVETVEGMAYGPVKLAEILIKSYVVALRQPSSEEFDRAIINFMLYGNDMQMHKVEQQMRDVTPFMGEQVKQLAQELKQMNAEQIAYRLGECGAEMVLLKKVSGIVGSAFSRGKEFVYAKAFEQASAMGKAQLAAQRQAVARAGASAGAAAEAEGLAAGAQKVSKAAGTAEAAAAEAEVSASSAQKVAAPQSAGASAAESTVSSGKVPKGKALAEPRSGGVKAAAEVESEVAKDAARAAESLAVNAEYESTLVKPLGRGSTGRTEAKNLYEQLAMKEVMSDPLPSATKIGLKKGMTDPRWPAEDGWIKMSKNVIAPDGSNIDIHYVYNERMHLFDDFKFKDTPK
jgi:hypothetical protein